MSTPNAFRPVNSEDPCAICGKKDWCRRTTDGACECHRIDVPAVNGYARIARTRAGFTVYRRPQDRRIPSKRTSAPNSKLPRIFDSPEAAAECFARWKKGTVERIYRWTETWCRARIRLTDGKTFCEITQEDTGWVLRGPPKPHPLYRIGELPPDGIIVVCEGEKACDAGWSIGLPCVTSGASDSARSADWGPLRGREVVILPDHDAPGMRYAQEVARRLKSLDRAAVVKILELPGLDDGEDLHDFINEHRDSRESEGIKAEIIALIESASACEGPDEPDSSEGHWLEPTPLPDGLPPVLPFDFGLLPLSLRPWLEDIAERMQCPPDFPAVAAMIALAAVVGRRVGIRPKRQDDWLVVPNLWGAIIGRPGVMKSPVIAEVLKPLKRLEQEAREDHERRVNDHEADKIVQEQRWKVAKQGIRKALQGGADANALASELLVSEASAPSRRRYIINDTTVEKLGELLNQNANGLLVFRDELIGLLKSLDRDGQEGSRAFYLEAWNGAGHFTFDRIGRGTLDIEAACLSVMGGIQPGVIGEYLRAATHSGRGDDGLIQRFQLAVWPDVHRTWRNVDRWPNTEARDKAYALFMKLDALDSETLQATRDGRDVEGIPYLRFAENAQGTFDAWRTTLEAKIRSDEHPAVEAHLAKYRSLVPSLALLIHLADEGTGPVTLSCLERAIGWATYLESHARCMYARVTWGDVHAARALVARLQANDLSDHFSLRDVYRRHWSGLATREEARQAVAMLVDHGWLSVEREATGGAPRTMYRVHPALKNRDPALPASAKSDTSPMANPSGTFGTSPTEASGVFADEDSRGSRIRRGDGAPGEGVESGQ